MIKQSDSLEYLKSCNVCGKHLNSWDLRCSKALGYKKPICEKCIALEYDKTTEEIREIMKSYFGMIPCLGI